MRRKKRNHLYLLATLLSLAGLIYLLIFINPSQNFPILSFKIPAVILFFVLIFIFIQSLASYILKNLRRGILIGLLAISFLLFAMYNFIHPFFIIMVLALFGVLELVFSNRR